jgi:hypothetical protein
VIVVFGRDSVFRLSHADCCCAIVAKSMNARLVIMDGLLLRKIYLKSQGYARIRRRASVPIFNSLLLLCVVIEPESLLALRADDERRL